MLHSEKPMMPRLIVGCLAGLLCANVTLAVNANRSPKAQDVYDPSQWTVVKSATANFGEALPKARVLLLKSVEATGRSGIGEPLNAVNLVVASAGKVAYSFSPLVVPPQDHLRTDPVFQVDDVLDLRDLTGDRIPEIVFHAGFLGASDEDIEVHVLQFAKHSPVPFRDIRADTFVDSWWTGVRFLDLDGSGFAVVAEPVDPPVAPGDFVAHGQPRFHRYLVYRWNRKNGRFELRQTIPETRHLHESAWAGLQSDWSYIVATMRKHD